MTRGRQKPPRIEAVDCGLRKGAEHRALDAATTTLSLALSRSRVLLVNREALSRTRMEENQRFRELDVIADPLKNRLFLASVTMPFCLMKSGRHRHVRRPKVWPRGTFRSPTLREACASVEADSTRSSPVGCPGCAQVLGIVIGIHASFEGLSGPGHRLIEGRADWHTPTMRLRSDDLYRMARIMHVVPLGT
jgi:hypothetical protein